MTNWCNIQSPPVHLRTAADVVPLLWGHINQVKIQVRRFIWSGYCQMHNAIEGTKQLKTFDIFIMWDCDTVWNISNLKTEKKAKDQTQNKHYTRIFVKNLLLLKHKWKCQIEYLFRENNPQKSTIDMKMKASKVKPQSITYQSIAVFLIFQTSSKLNRFHEFILNEFREIFTFPNCNIFVFVIQNTVIHC